MTSLLQDPPEAVGGSEVGGVGGGGGGGGQDYRYPCSPIALCDQDYSQGDNSCFLS